MAHAEYLKVQLLYKRGWGGRKQQQRISELQDLQARPRDIIRDTVINRYNSEVASRSVKAIHQMLRTRPSTITFEVGSMFIVEMIRMQKNKVNNLCCHV